MDLLHKEIGVQQTTEDNMQLKTNEENREYTPEHTEISSDHVHNNKLTPSGSHPDMHKKRFVHEIRVKKT